MEWALALYGELNVPRVWIPEQAFVDAARADQSLTFTRKSKNGTFGLAMGPQPVVFSHWDEFAIPQDADRHIAGESTFHDNWEVHALATSSRSYEIEPLEDDEFITHFLATHAPKSSAQPGNPEIQFWGSVRNSAGEIAAIAAITEWESGEKMLSSVATHTDMRGQGFAQKVCSGIVGLAFDRGIDRINLVVLSNNAPAIQAYSKIGFTCIGKFSSFSR
jgi:ribosomal protein S18 acetylase RimI-like enzyme